MIRKTNLLTFVLLIVRVLGFGAGHGQLVKVDDFGSNPGHLKMFVYGNEHKKDSASLPLVIVLHGCGQSAHDAAELTGWNKLADLNKFIVLYPQQRFLNNPDLCFNWFNACDIEKGQGECESIYQMILFMRRHYRIDSSKVFITGMSAGAAMSVVMMAIHPEVFRCGAIFAGGAYKMGAGPFAALACMKGDAYMPREILVKNVLEQNPDYTGKFPEMIVYQGLNDPIVNYRNSIFLINQWTGINKCDTIPDKIDSAFMNVADITRKEYLNSEGEKVVLFYEVNNLGHRLLVKPGDKPDEGGRTGMFGLNKGFHSTYQTAVDFNIIRE